MMETKTSVAQPTEFIIPKATASWHFERKLKPDDKKIGNYVLIQPGAPDVAKVLKAYAHHSISDYNIVSIEILYNEMLNRQFYGHLKLMDARKGNPKYIPSWRKTVTGTEKTWREATWQQLQTLSDGYGDPDVPNILLLPLWHGTSDQVSNYIFSGGYGIFSSNDSTIVTDEGYFGKGVYTAHEAEYAFRSYAKKHGDKAVLLLNWVSTFEAYPVIDGDMSKLQGKMGGYDQCDAHFIPVRSDYHPDTDIYHPCAEGQTPDYHEMVVFTYQQCLPRYRVKLIQNAPQPLIEDAASLCYQNALDALGLGQYGSVANAFEDAASVGHPGAAVRLHWWYSGGSGIIAVNPQALSKVQAVQTSSVNVLKQKANFRRDNDPESQFTLAWCYQHGLGCEVNLAKAAQYYWIAAEQGHQDAQYQLGVCCAAGIGIKPDMSQVITYYERAAKLGHIHAHYVLWQCYESGLGIKANSTKALEHKQAAQKGKHPQLVGVGLPQTISVSGSSNVQLEQEVKQLKQQLAQQAAMLKEKESQLIQQISTSKQKELELIQKESKLKQQQDKAVQDQQKIKELIQTSQSKDELITRQKEEQKKKDEIIVKQNQEKAAQEAQLRDKDQWLQYKEQLLQQQMQKATDLSKELQLTQQKLGQKDEMIATQWFENEQLKKDLVESKEREQRLKAEFEAHKKFPFSPQTPVVNLQAQPNPFLSIFSTDREPKPVLNSQQQEKQNRLVEACLKGDSALVEQLESQGASFSYPNREGLYPLVAAVYGCSLEMVRYIDLRLGKNEAEKQWSQVDVNKAKTELDRWTPTELSTNATYGELGNWYVKYQGASWCAYYDSECLKRESCQRWGGWEESSKWGTWDLKGNGLWGAGSIRVRILSALKEREISISIHTKQKAGMWTWPWGDTDNILSSPSVKLHNDVVKIIREQFNKLRSEVESKVKRSSAVVFNPKV